MIHQQCSRCILDTKDDPRLELDSAGVCNHCRGYDAMAAAQVRTGADGERELSRMVEKIRRGGEGRSYDCVMGLSGGVDSTYVAYLAKRHGLRPLAVHFDNGWNSEIAVKNIHNIVSRLGIDLHTLVVDWEEFRDVQLAYLKASVVDIEAVTDHAIIGTLYRLAAKHGTRYILSGTNVVTEAVLPSHWIFNKTDHVNLKAIHRAFGTRPLRTFPIFNFWSKKYYVDLLGIRPVEPLNLVPYVKADVKARIAAELGWRDYGGKHYESVFTRFYQGYILPRKFGIDKRKAHLSNLVCSSQITREEALREMEEPIYDPELLKVDREFVLKKLGLSEAEFETIMATPPRDHASFAVERPARERYPAIRLISPVVSTARRMLAHA